MLKIVMEGTYENIDNIFKEAILLKLKLNTCSHI